MAVCECNNECGDGDRYCRNCGRNLQESPGVLLSLSGEPGTETAFSHVRRDRQYWLPILVCGAVVIGIWGLVSLGTAPTAESTAPSEENNSEAAAQQAEPDGQNEEPAADSTLTKNNAGSTSTAVPQPSSGSSQRTPSGPTTPVLGQPVKYDLLVSTSGRPAILDLDQAEVTSHKGGQVRPVAVSGPWLILEGRSSDGPERLPLDDLGGDPVPIFDDRDLVFSNAMPTLGETEPGTMWFSIYRESANGSSFIPSLELVDLSLGTTVFHPLAAEGIQTIDLFGGRFANGSEGLLTGPSGGVYEASQDGYRLVVDGGKLIAADQHRALVETCDARLRCERSWLDTDAWEPLDLHVPDNEAFFTVVIPNTDWILTVRLNDTILGTLLHAETGRTHELPLRDSASSLPLPAISPDGRWLAQVDEDGHSVFFQDLLSGNTTRFEFGEPIEPPLFFIAD